MLVITSILLAITCSSWSLFIQTPASVSIFSNYLNSTEFTVVKTKINQKQITDFLKGTNSKKRTNNFVSIARFYYNMSQLGDPYLDANLKIKLDGEEKVFVFTDNSGYFDQLTASTAPQLLEIDCPIFDQWQDVGIYHLTVIGHSYSTDTYTTLINTIWHRDAYSTPDISSFYRTLSVTSGNEYFIYLTAS